MSALLRLLVTGEWPAGTTACDWALYDARGQLLQRGSSEPRHWPAAEACELVLGADQCLTLDAKLPKGVKAGAAGTKTGDGDLLAFAVEESLVGDVENEHIVAGKTGSDGRTPVWVVSRARLLALLAGLRQLGRSPSRVLSELQFAPFAEGHWSICLREHGGFARIGSENGFVLDGGLRPEPPVTLRLALQAAKKSENAPESIDIYCAQGFDVDATIWPAWQSALGVPVRRTGEYAWRNVPAGAARNLLVGEFAPQGERGTVWAAFKPALALGALSLVLYSVFSVGEWIWLDHKAGNLRTEAVEVFRAAFPQVQTIVDPSLQMQRLYDQLKRDRGQLGEGDFLPLLAAVSEALAGQGTFRSISYEEGRLELTAALSDAAASERLRDRLAKRGLAPTLRETRPAGAGIEASFSVRLGQ
jgi:general secretion pathway protein L